LGDLLARGAENSLTMGLEVGYPGDSLYECDPEDVSSRFTVYCVSDTQHVIMDGHCGEDTLIKSEHLADPEFELPRWYAEQRAQAIG
ncbi:hypothetical protein DFH07DRAFT_722311, partial [Mycena maculata]